MGAHVAIALIRAYRLLLSPLLPRSCRFHPTCSRYALECFERFGFFTALGKTLHRLLRCHPFHPGGHDPVT
ncbi:MAG: membrane protein insertion efficiency factor YidD [Deltaproteobacteria bacterium RIFOXYA12_FULL_61_11]|nr:MAG: membrane protein insertion efficiency factor YidD [Deltaproteobacteria bacterium RIFOXYA12_FULL_61_11]